MQIPTNQPENNKSLNKRDLIVLSFELGYIIALPLVAFGLAGKWVDGHYHHSFPWVTLIGIALAIASTTIWITRKLKKYIK